MSLLVEENLSLASLTTLKTGGAARYCIAVSTTDELKKAVNFAQQKALPFFVVGGGSNLLASDDGYTGVIILMNIKGRTYLKLTDNDVEATFGAGEILDEIIDDTVTLGYWGLENLSHIPGTVGATPIQNVGAYGVEVSELIKNVDVYDTETQLFRQLSARDCLFMYRDSVFKTTAAKKYIITAVTFRLSKTAMPRLSYASLQSAFITEIVTQTEIRTKIISIRSTKFPDWHTVGTAGSFFKNPIISTEHAQQLVEEYPGLPTYEAGEGRVKVLLGYVLDKVCGLRGYQNGQVSLSFAQALVLVAETGATTSDIELFARQVCTIVFQKTNITIENEVTKIV